MNFIFCSGSIKLVGECQLVLNSNKNDNYDLSMEKFYHRVYEIERQTNPLRALRLITYELEDKDKIIDSR